MTPRRAWQIAAFLGFLAVALGAFGAHALKDRLTALGRTATWETAVFYHAIHAVALLAVARAPRFSPVAAWCFLAGVLMFSGSLYALSLVGVNRLGIITPFGGVLFMVGWIFLGWKGWKDE